MLEHRDSTVQPAWLTIKGVVRAPAVIGPPVRPSPKKRCDLVMIGSLPVRLILSCVAGLLCLFAPRSAPADEPPRFELKDGDRIVLVGDTFIERDQRYGYLETFLSISNPDKNLVFRNLGWSGDTVGGVSRSGFDPPQAGFEQLRQQILAVKPTVVIIGYGMADSFAGEAGVAAFEQGLARLLNVIDSTRARIAFLSPIPHARLRGPLPDPTGHNHDLALYRDLIKRVAAQRKAAFVDLFDRFNTLFATAADSLTDDGIHLTEKGYRQAAYFISHQLSPRTKPLFPVLVLGQDGKVIGEIGTRATSVEKTGSGLRFEVVDPFLPPPLLRRSDGSNEMPGNWWQLVVQGLAEGEYVLKIDGVPVASAGAGEWKLGVIPKSAPQFDQAQALRSAINRKNDLFFYRWRPQNITYLVGFRKHEQGNNAVEIPQFDPLVAEQEKLIARLKKPVEHLYELTRVEKKKEVAR
jgi:lysophospholipase L1-like esterase